MRVYSFSLVFCRLELDLLNTDLRGSEVTLHNTDENAYTHLTSAKISKFSEFYCSILNTY